MGLSGGHGLGAGPQLLFSQGLSFQGPRIQAAGADDILIPAIDTVSRLTEYAVQAVVKLARTQGVLVMSTISPVRGLRRSPHRGHDHPRRDKRCRHPIRRRRGLGDSVPLWEYLPFTTSSIQSRGWYGRLAGSNIWHQILRQNGTPVRIGLGTRYRPGFANHCLLLFWIRGTPHWGSGSRTLLPSKCILIRSRVTLASPDAVADTVRV